MNAAIAGAAWVLPLTFALLALGAALILLRLVSGPRAPDRVVAIDALSMIAIAAIALLALATAQPMLLDAAVVLSLVYFLGTTAFILLFHRRGRGAGEVATGADARLLAAGAAPGSTSAQAAGTEPETRETRAAGGAAPAPAVREARENGEAAR
ncbi:multiple resistance and pH regulation protein F [Thauera phenylacetica B4P]|uniref:Multiple resistance and pH regulation protein F n=1 Tax=Thauera phenylacetica B4P TaxID=1234382 RepID=N6YY80_9RHOO|nr:monovalent cation/H+ antiporter complex subunit F [Thauera phenylacetica]ENO96550.1 multiple resistance and pH regulation protein F [Thauera phenylacetica B4P]